MESTAAVDRLTDKQKYDFKRALEELKQLHGRGTELISLYIPPEKQIYDVAAYLRNEYSQSSNIKSQSTRKNVQGAIQSILSRLKVYKKPPQNGLAIFVGEVAVGGDQTRMTQFVLEPPEPITTFLYRCDSEFYLEPLLEMLSEKKAYGLIVIDRSEATIGILRGKRVQAIKNIQSLVPSKHRMGGQSALRFERLIEIAAHEFFTKVGETANEIFLNMKDLHGILIGGPGPTKDYFYESGYLHHEIQKKVIGTFDTGYTDEYGLKELMEKAKEKLEDLDLMREKRLMQRLFEEIRKTDGGLAAYGEEEVRRNLMIGAVDTLLVSEGLRKRRITISCPSCGYSETITADSEPQNLQCPKCKGQALISANVDFIDELYELASNVGTKVELISEDSEEGEMLLKAFGGIAAILRFRTGG